MEKKRAWIKKGIGWIVAIKRTCLELNACSSRLIRTSEDYEGLEPIIPTVFFASSNNDGRKRSNERNLINTVDKASPPDSIFNVKT